LEVEHNGAEDMTDITDIGSANALTVAPPPELLQLEAAPRNSMISQDQAAVLFADAYAGRLRYDYGRGRWYIWAGTHWQEDQKNSVFELVRHFVRGIAHRVDSRSRESLGRLSFAEKVEKGARSDVRHAITSSEWDAKPFLLATPGGTVDLKSGLLRAADPNDLLTKMTAVAPSPTADCPRFLQFLSEATGGDAKLIRFLQQFCGYSLTGSIREHALAFVYGSGGNGKSVFANTIVGILKDYAVVAPMEALVATNNHRHETELAMLCGARLVSASETERGKAWAEARVKRLTGGDPITARFMHKDHFTFRPTFKLLILGNHKPSIRTVDEAIRRRINIVPFLHVPTEPDLALEARLREEWLGIMRWMIIGALDWQKAGLIRPPCVAEATAEYSPDRTRLANGWPTSAM
jgi:putative DNA primase/helicase